MKKRAGFSKTTWIFICCILFASAVNITWRKEPNTTAEPNTKATNTGDYEKGYHIRYLDKQVAMVVIWVRKYDPEEKTRKLLDAAKAEIEKTDVYYGDQKYIDCTIPLKPIKSLTEDRITTKKFLVILQLPDPNSPP